MAGGNFETFLLTYKIPELTISNLERIYVVRQLFWKSTTGEGGCIYSIGLTGYSDRNEKDCCNGYHESKLS